MSNASMKRYSIVENVDKIFRDDFTETSKMCVYLIGIHKATKDMRAIVSKYLRSQLMEPSFFLVSFWYDSKILRKAGVRWNIPKGYKLV